MESRKIVSATIRILVLLIALMVVIKFAYVFYDFLQNPFHGPMEVSKDALRHFMLSLILVEILALTLQIFLHDTVDPDMLLVIILTALTRHILVLNFDMVNYQETLAIGVLLAITLWGLHIFRSKKISME